MAKKKNLYNVGYGRNRGNPNVDYDVDLFNLPYDKATPDDPLVIFYGDGEETVVDMGKCRNRPWPDFSNVCIAGALDCQHFTIDANTVLPICFDKLICRYSINDLGVLIGLLPADFMTAPEPTIVVRSAILNNVKADKDGALATARRFMEMYPNVVVTDEKKLVLSDIIAEHDRAKSEPVIAASSQTSAAQKSVQKNSAATIKDDTWLSTEEMGERCKDASQLIAGLPKGQIKRYIQMARSDKAGLELMSAKCVRSSDGATISCIHISEVQRVADYIERVVSDAAASAARKSDVVKTPKKTAPSTDKAAPQRPKYYFGEREVKPIKIKKYISKAAYGQIQTLCGTSTNKLLRILTDINKVNIPPSTKDGKVLYVEDNELKPSTNINLRGGGACLSQEFETTNGRPRIVWCVSKNCFVCQKVFTGHEGRKKLQYDDYVNETKINVEELDLSKYLYVPDLIAELSAGKEIVTEPVAKPAVEPVAKPAVEPVAKPVEQTSPVVAQRLSDDTAIQTLPSADAETVTDEPVEPVVKNKKRIRLIRTKYEQTRRRPAVEPVAEPAAEPVAKPVAEPVAEPVVPNTAESNVVWQEFASVSYKYEQRINFLTGTQKMLIQQLSKETETQELLQTAQNLQAVLEQKQKCERALEKMRQMNEALKKLQQMLDEHKI